MGLVCGRTWSSEADHRSAGGRRPPLPTNRSNQERRIRMRVVKVIPDFGIGGIQKAGCLLAVGLGAAGHEAIVVGSGGGPRLLDRPPQGVTHRLIERTDDESFSRAILELRPDVVHMHGAGYDEPLVARLASLAGAQGGGPLLVVTPVFGRPPADRATLGRCRTCLLGAYMFYRQRHWLGMTADAAMRRGVGFVWLNSFETTDPPQSTLDPPEVASARREALGVPPDALVIGRIGRDNAGKWHMAYPSIVERVLTEHPNAAWLSVGMPEERGRSELKRRFGPRFSNHPETTEYLKLAQALAAMDVQVFFSRAGECFSTTICEAAGVGLPTIAGINPLTDNGQTEQIVDGVNGYLVATADQAVERVGRLMADRAALEQMKRDTFEYAHARWTTGRIIADLLAFYDAWRSDDPLSAPYLQWVRQQEAEFAAQYRARMLELLADGPMSRLAWRMKLSAVANWNTFRVGRLFRRFLR